MHVVSRVVIIASTGGWIVDDMLEASTAKLPVTLVDASLPDEEKASLCKDAEVIIPVLYPISVDVVKNCPRLKLLQLLSAGFDKIDVPAIQKLGVKVANNSAAIAPSVAEHAITLMLCVYRHVAASIRDVQEGKWNQGINPSHLRELTGKTVGIVGIGHIGQLVAKQLRGFDTTTLYYDSRPVPPSLEQQLNVQRVPLDTLLSSSDIVTLHVPLNHHTRGMISHRELSIMKPSDVLINTCRGPVVDEKALHQALKEKRIAGAGLDVLEQEPTPKDNPLLELENVVITPHTGGAGYETTQRIIFFAIENTKRVISGQEPLSLVVAEE